MEFLRLGHSYGLQKHIGQIRKVACCRLHRSIMNY